MARIYAQVVQGAPKESSDAVTDEESGAFWDTVTAEVETMRNKGFIFEVPNTPTLDLEEQGMTVEDVKRMQQEYAESKGLPWPPEGAAPAEPVEDPASPPAEPETEPADE